MITFNWWPLWFMIGNKLNLNKPYKQRKLESVNKKLESKSCNGSNFGLHFLYKLMKTTWTFLTEHMTVGILTTRTKWLCQPLTVPTIWKSWWDFETKNVVCSTICLLNITKDYNIEQWVWIAVLHMTNQGVGRRFTVVVRVSRLRFQWDPRGSGDNSLTIISHIFWAYLQQGRVLILCCCPWIRFKHPFCGVFPWCSFTIHLQTAQHLHIQHHMFIAYHGYENIKLLSTKIVWISDHVTTR